MVNFKHDINDEDVKALAEMVSETNATVKTMTETIAGFRTMFEEIAAKKIVFSGMIFGIEVFKIEGGLQ